MNGFSLKLGHSGPIWISQLIDGRTKGREGIKKDREEQAKMHRITAPAMHAALHFLRPSVMTPPVTWAQLMAQLKNKQWFGSVACLQQKIHILIETALLIQSRFVYGTRWGMVIILPQSPMSLFPEYCPSTFLKYIFSISFGKWSIPDKEKESAKISYCSGAELFEGLIKSYKISPA